MAWRGACGYPPPGRARASAADLPLKGGGAMCEEDGEERSVRRVQLIVRRYLSGEKLDGTASRFSWLTSSSPLPLGGQMPRFTASSRMRWRSPASL